MARTRLFKAQVIAVGVSAVGAVFAASAVTVMSAPTTPQAQQVPAQPALSAPVPGDEGPLVAEGQPADLAIIYTGGVVGYVEPCG